MQEQHSLMWQKVAYYAPFLSHDNIEKAVSFIEAKERCIRHSTITENDVRHSSRTEFEFPPRLSPELSEEEREDQKSQYDTRMLLGALEDVVNRLRLSSVSLAAIHEFIDNHQALSRMVITNDYRLFLPDYNNMEIEMTALPKALFFLFLRYPEGIVLKELQNHYTELLNIYRQLRPNVDEAKRALTVTKLVNPLSNAANENIARIRKAFVEKFDMHLSKNYIVTGSPGEAYAIPLDRNLIVWQD